MVEELPPPPPHAAITNKPTLASASARIRVTPCIRVLPLLTDDPAAFFPESLGDRGESAPAAGLTQQPPRLKHNSGSKPGSVKYALSAPAERLFDRPRPLTWGD